MRKKGILAALMTFMTLLLGLGATASGDAQQKTCCPVCSPPEVCCCR
jgi:hypothetical protein